MGKPVKVSDLKTPWCRRELRRKTRLRPSRERILIVCEGERTEPNYFNALGRTLMSHVVELVVEGPGMNTLSLVREAIRLRDTEADGPLPYDQTWAVFDRNSFPPHDFDNAIHKAGSDNVKCAWTNEAFELWYVLHFEYRTTAMSRDEYKGRLTELLDQEYKKNAPDMYRQLAAKGNEAQAIDWARRLDEEATVGRTLPSRANPCTTVYRLVEELNRFRPSPGPDANA